MKKFAVVVAMLGFSTFVHAQNAAYEYCKAAKKLENETWFYVEKCLAKNPSKNNLVKQIQNIKYKVCGKGILSYSLVDFEARNQYKANPQKTCHKFGKAYRANVAFFKKGGTKQILRGYKQAILQDKQYWESMKKRRPKWQVCTNHGSWGTWCSDVE